jgi:hypothetical protein
MASATLRMVCDALRGYLYAGEPMRMDRVVSSNAGKRKFRRPAFWTGSLLFHNSRGGFDGANDTVILEPFSKVSRVSSLRSRPSKPV